MLWTDEIIAALKAAQPCGYHSAGPASCEPTAYAALALLDAGQFESAQKALDWLAQLQQSDGAVGPTEHQTSPQWGTSLAMLAWLFASEHPSGRFVDQFQSCISSAIEWMLFAHGKTMPRGDETAHDSTIIGWPWVLETHSWLEPTCLHVLALRSAGRANHLRTRDGMRMILDRLLTTGGCNYGNTLVLGQQLRPHVQPTGLAMMALADYETDDVRIERSLAYLEEELPISSGAASISFAALGLAAHGRFRPEYHDILRHAYQRTSKHGSAPSRLALLYLAARAQESPLISILPSEVVA